MIFYNICLKKVFVVFAYHIYLDILELLAKRFDKCKKIYGPVKNYKQILNIFDIKKFHFLSFLIGSIL